MIDMGRRVAGASRELFAPWVWPTAGLVRDLRGLSPVLFRAGAFEVRLATTRKEIRRAQRLRFKAFYGEGGAIPSHRNALSGRDTCPFDAICDHLLVIDEEAVSARGLPKRRIVGTYRVLRGDVAARQGGFYSGTEFALAPMLERHPDKRFLELGRACVHPDYRSRRVIELLWRGIGLYAQFHRTDALLGCASLPGTDVAALATSLSFLHHHAAAEAPWQVHPLPGRAATIPLIEKNLVDRRRALAGLPPLVKAYVRAGGRFTTGAVVDHRFKTTDVFTVLPFVDADARYMLHFGGSELGRGVGGSGH